VPADTTVPGPVGSTSTVAGPSTTTVDSTTATAPRVDAAAMAAAEYFIYGLDGIRSDAGQLIWEPDSLGSRSQFIVRDGQGGFVFLAAGGLWWVRSGADSPVLVAGPDWTFGWPREVITTDDGPVVRLQKPAVGDVLVDVFVDLASDQVVDVTSDGRIRNIAGQEWWVVGDLAVTVTYAQVEWLEEGGVAEVIEPAHLIVSRASDGTPSTPLFDIVIGTDGEEWARIHDFDGRRIVVSTLPYEPASPRRPSMSSTWPAPTVW